VVINKIPVYVFLPMTYAPPSSSVVGPFKKLFGAGNTQDGIVCSYLRLYEMPVPPLVGDFVITPIGRSQIRTREHENGVLRVFLAHFGDAWKDNRFQFEPIEKVLEWHRTLLGEGWTCHGPAPDEPSTPYAFTAPTSLKGST